MSDFGGPNFIGVFRVLVNCFCLTEILNIAPTFGENFSPIENFAMIDRAWRTIVETYSQSAVFHFDMSSEHFV